MKRVIVALMFFVLSAPLLAQTDAQAYNNLSSRLDETGFFTALENVVGKTLYSHRYVDGRKMPERHMLGPGRYENYALDKPLPLKKGKLYLLAYDEDEKCFFAHSSGIYLGEYRQEKGKATYIRDGLGIDQTNIYGTDKTKYYIGYYKNNKRHGKGFFVDPKGKMYAGEWKHGRLVGKTKRNLTPEEEEKVGDYVRKINNLL